MARPIRETPILYGEDAENFVRRMQRVESLSKEKRAANRKKLESQYQEALKFITVCL